MRRRAAAAVGRAARRALGATDGEAVAGMALREFRLAIRSAHYRRFIIAWQFFCALLLLGPLLYRSQLGQWRSPDAGLMYQLLAHLLVFGCAVFSAQWSMRRLRRDLYTSRLDELMLSRCSPGDIAVGEGLAGVAAMLLLILVTLPTALLLAALGGYSPAAAIALLATMAPVVMLGAWFGLGWGLAFASRSPLAIWPMTQWWVLAPLAPLIAAWSLLGAFPVIWLLMGLIPGGHQVVEHVALAAREVVLWMMSNLNPLLAVHGTASPASGEWPASWLTLLGVTAFLTMKSASAIQISLRALQAKEETQKRRDAWIHHDVHYFLDYGRDERRTVEYRDGGNPVAAFDVALGHRVFLHPFLWCLGLLAYLSLLVWSLLVPGLALWAGTAAVLLPATAALLLMSGGVAISFGWERDQERWTGLASLPMSDLRLATGKIKGVVRPTLWLGLMAAVTSLLLGWRGALPAHSSYWMALHVAVFPVALAFVSATLALNTPTIGEALLRWAVLGAIPTFAYLLPPPIGGDAGIALPLSPPLLMLVVIAHGLTSPLLAACWAALALEILGIALGLLLLAFRLRRWTVGEQ